MTIHGYLVICTACLASSLTLMGLGSAVFFLYCLDDSIVGSLVGLSIWAIARIPLAGNDWGLSRIKRIREQQ